MFQRVYLAATCALLAGCGDPLSGLDRISDVELSQDSVAPAAIPSDEEIAREAYFGTSAAASSVAPSIDPVAKPMDPPRRGGLLGLLRRNESAESEAGAVAANVATRESTPVNKASAASAPPLPATAPKGHSGFLSRLLGRAEPTNAKEVASEPPQLEDEGEAEPAQLATLNSDASALPEPSAKPARSGLFQRLVAQPGRTPKARTGPDARDLDYGTLLPFGEVARVCAARGRPLGRRVEKAPANGYALYDSAPGAGGPRTFYVTGFNDGCPRQLTAANVLLGSASLYEQLHYGPGGEHLPSAETDKAYDQIKRRICGTGRGKPCGARINKMERSTFFVTAYGSFANSNRWSELLIHDGELRAAAIKSNN